MVALFLSADAPVTGRILCRISTENAPGHFQARALRKFSELVAESIGGSLMVEFYDGARLFRDIDAIGAIGAIARGDLEIAAPGIWQLDKYAPDTAVLMLPSVYGRSREIIRTLVDGPLGAVLSEEIEAAMRVVVLGRWLDLGYAHTFGGKTAIRSVGDIRGRHIRVAGGRANEERVKALGGLPVSIPMLDLPAYLERDLVDGIVSTYETVDSAGLDASGLGTVLEDEQYYPFYVPIVNAALWARLDDAQRYAIASAWVAVVADARLEAVRAQDEAKARLVSRGLAVYRPTREQATATRRALMAQEDGMASRLNISGRVLGLLRDELPATVTR